ncbi:hypothetical protein AQI84_03460 [Streptomyces griseorubiginosus]|nr:hypothetical protein AQI84_03460 [Streptomyces griseorubiginosus]
MSGADGCGRVGAIFLARRTLSPRSSSSFSEQATRNCGKRVCSSSAMCERTSLISSPTSRSNSGSSAAQPSRSFMSCSAVEWSSISRSAMVLPLTRCSRTAGYRYSSSATECRISSMVAWSAYTFRFLSPGGSASIFPNSSSTSR